MTEEQVRSVGPSFAGYLGGSEWFFDPRSIEHLGSCWRGLWTDLLWKAALANARKADLPPSGMRHDDMLKG